MVCFLYSGHEFRVGAVRPEAPEIQEVIFQIAERVHGKGSIYAISEDSFSHTFAFYDKLPSPRIIVKGVEITEGDLKQFGEEFRTFDELAGRHKGTDTSSVVTMLVAAALQSRSSDIHVEAEEKRSSPARIDGICTRSPRSQRRIQQITSASDSFPPNQRLDIPQDTVSRFISQRKSGCACFLIPTAYGESIVMRLLRGTANGLAFEDLGLRGKSFEDLKREVERPNGMIMTTGPTGSGKTTTLYAVLNKLNDEETKIITLEDPVEYRMAGISQSQIDHSRDYTFAKGLRSILRQDPDIVMVGEIRDLETAEISIQAASPTTWSFPPFTPQRGRPVFSWALGRSTRPVLNASSANVWCAAFTTTAECWLDEAMLARVKNSVGYPRKRLPSS